MAMPIVLQERLIREYLHKNYPEQEDTIDVRALISEAEEFPINKANIEMHIIKESFKGETDEGYNEGENNRLKDKLAELDNKYRNLQRQKIRIVKQEMLPSGVGKIEPSEWDVSSLFDKPKILGLIGNSNSGKSNLIYWLLRDLSEFYDFKTYSYGLRNEIEGVKKIFSVSELEQIKDSIIMIDELSSLFDFEDRKERGRIEKTIRVIHHNNNVLLLCGTGENFKKFISAKLSAIFFKKTAISDLINGSRAKEIMLGYNGDEMGSTTLNLEHNEAVLWDGTSYKKLVIPYLEIYDMKQANVPILVPKNAEKVRK